MFRDSETAQKFRCGRTKATNIVKEIGAMTTNSIAERMKKQPFTLSTDGSNDKGGTKMFPLVVRTVDEDGAVNSDVLAVPVCEGSATGMSL